jgi:uncharacterized damage-inducible protein DinB
MHPTIACFKETWAQVRGRLTFDFVEAVPDDRWEFSPHPGFAPFNKQVRHIVCVQGVYLQGLRERTANFGTKHSHYDGPLGRRELRAALQQKDAELDAALQEIDAAGVEAFRIDWFGSQIGLDRYLQVVVQHEAIHHGQWSFYATLGGFQSPLSWKFGWGL